MGIADGSSLGTRLMKVLSAKVKELSIPVKMNSKVLDLIIRDGKAVGVVVENGKEKYKVFADNVVLATGRFQSEPKIDFQIRSSVERFAYHNCRRLHR